MDTHIAREEAMMLKYSEANAKLVRLYDVPEMQEWLTDGRFYGEVWSLDLLSGWSCPMAEACLSKVYEIKDQISPAGNTKKYLKDGKKATHRCFSTSQEVKNPSLYKLRKHNYDTLRKAKTEKKMLKLLQDSMPRNASVVRQHVGGGFFNEIYFKAWLRLAELNPHKLFYAYMKSLSYWINNIDWVNRLPNVVLTASRGGKQDYLIDEHNLREAVVVFDEARAEELGLEIDHDDSHAARPDLREQSFALLIHGVQAAGSEASKAVSLLKGKGTYSR